jgi:ankyrin repeat protein
VKFKKGVKMERLKEEILKALKKEDWEKVKFLMKHLKNAELINAVKMGDLKKVRELLRDGADVNAKDRGQTALMLACEEGNEEIIDELLKNGADVNAVDDVNYRTALIKAVIYNHFQVVKKLVEAGADLEKRDYLGFTAFLHAVWWERMEIIKFLVEKGANIHAQDCMNQTALRSACIKKNFKIADYLIKKGLDVNAQDIHGETALMDVCYWGDYYIDVVKFLLENGADITIKNKAGKDALTIAKERGHSKIIKLLEEKLTSQT